MKSRLNYNLSHLSMKGWTRLWKHDKPYEFFVFITYLASIQFVRAPEANQVYLSWSPTNSTGTGRSSSLNPCLSTRGENVCNKSHHHQYHQNHHHHYYQCHQQPVQQFVTDFIEIILKNYMKTVSAIDHLTMKTAQPKCLYYYNIMIP